MTSYTFLTVPANSYFETIMSYETGDLTMWNDRAYISLTDYSTTIVISDASGKNSMSFWFPANAFAVCEYETVCKRLTAVVDRARGNLAFFRQSCELWTRQYGLDRAWHSNSKEVTMRTYEARTFS